MTNVDREQGLDIGSTPMHQRFNAGALELQETSPHTWPGSCEDLLNRPHDCAAVMLMGKDFNIAGAPS